MPHGLPARSMWLNVFCSPLGNSAAVSTRSRRTSIMCSICSLPTGQTSMQALQVVQAHAASSFSAKSSSGRGLSCPAEKPGKNFVQLIALVDQNRRRD